MKRRLFKFALFLLLGAIVNVAVATACAAWSAISTNDNWWLPATAPNPKMMSWLDNNKVYAASGREFKVVECEGLGVRFISFSEVKKEPPPALIMGPPVVAARHVEAGLPAQSMRGGQFYSRFTMPNSRPYTYINWGAIPLPQPEYIDHPSDLRAWLLPLYPIWPGFAINTVFYALILWLPLAPFQLRRYLRVKRNLCIKCGYDLRETSGGCPECGWGRESLDGSDKVSG